MKRPNVVLIVLDTLRGDSASGLERLAEMGFVKLEAVAPSSWTLPTHVSMFTGELSSTHKVHSYLGVGWGEMTGVSKMRMKGSTLLTDLKGKGYTTYGHSANQFVAPDFGFDFDHFTLHDAAGGAAQKGEGIPPTFYRRFIPIIMNKGVTGKFARWLVLGVLGRVLALMGVRAPEKGSSGILAAIRGEAFAEPFFTFVNLMEAHQPYLWWPLDTLTVRLSMLGRSPHSSWWRAMYPWHAGIAVSKGVQIAESLLKYDPLVIVTSDHGQLLGEKGKFGHGWCLDEALLKVPLWVRLPRSAGKVRTDGPLVGLSEVRRLVEQAVGGEECRVGADFAVSEAWGFEITDVRKLLEREGRAGDVFDTRVRVFSPKGSVLVNRVGGRTEEVSPGLSSEEARRLAALAPEVAEEDQPIPPPEVTQEDEGEMRERLKRLGYE